MTRLRLLPAAALACVALAGIGTSTASAQQQDPVKWAQGCVGYYTWQWDPLHGGPYCPDYYIGSQAVLWPPDRPEQPDPFENKLIAERCQKLTGRPNCQFLGP